LAELGGDDPIIRHIAGEHAHASGEGVDRGDRSLADRGVVKSQVAAHDARDQLSFARGLS
jgi:hypothetical protein